METEQGYVQVYTGSGKGKTTAALGLAMRAAGAGFKVFVGQFVKRQHYSELDSFSLLKDTITLKQYGSESFIYNTPEAEDIELAQSGLAEIREILKEGQHKLVIMDEANIATYFGLFDVEELIEIIQSKPDHVELVLTGRYVDPKIVELADLVTEMREIKHYYNMGVMARVGIEN
jgi:cob(I)alamin adenosyltransferase